METTSVKVAFDIYGEHFQPSAITDLLNVLPNSTIIKGIVPEGKNWPAVETKWCIDTGYEKSDDINIQLKKIIGLIQGKEDILNRIRSELNIDMLFDVVIRLENDEYPVMRLKPDVLKFIASISADIDFNVY
ncbi:DUF4279 domain-containing protein [Snodgrassella sp. ESL0253]|uniref:DUF4279 domain-containing protein n=1 Tax=Snodgrassella sp. ESL0253 TaxID=2705031 RepID=UPI001583CADA|nr:DUF4279 domain-containing protein [Snodgrassella sp. ESL0253]NUE67698.1 DUF4279 domain-containing protein [Snodgrassella sp. ESL0253]